MKNLLNKAEKALAKFEEIMAYISGVSIIVMMFAVTLDVLLRNLFKVQIIGVYEVSQYVFMPLIVLPSIGFIYHSGVLPKFDLLPIKKDSFIYWLMYVLISVVEVVIFALIAWYAVQSFLNAYREGKAVMVNGRLLPLWWVYLTAPLGFCTMFLDAFLVAVRRIVYRDLSAETAKS